MVRLRGRADKVHLKVDPQRGLAHPREGLRQVGVARGNFQEVRLETALRTFNR